ncbi:HD-GYP domain-containing protein [Paenibacillus sanguinis]|uniref:HD-GYP domain-containing protein n=1 Tax=Paenibacillus sanguinis TaxID=225906 RepID=UPI0003724F09|nr:HD domain-containing phosphohydrolase [Paenibacillus sanguinis]
MSSLQDAIVHQELIKLDASPLFQWIDFMSEERPDFYRHSLRVAMIADRLGTQMKLSYAEQENLLRGCFLHDLGKLTLPLDLLEQVQPLSQEQWNMIRLHPQTGADLVHTLSEFEESVIEVILHHHERWDGQGYPHGLQGSDIPLLARICAVADSFDAMLSPRPYRQPLSANEARLELINHSNLQFDPDIVCQMLKLVDSEMSYCSFIQER